MKVDYFYDTLRELADESSWKNREKILRQNVLQRDDWRPATVLLAGQRFDNNGVAPKRACKSLHEAFPSRFSSVEEVKQLRNDHGTVTDLLIEIEDSLPEPENPDATVENVYNSLERVGEASGKELLSKLAQAFRMYRPSVVSYGALDDYSVGVKSKTVKNAIGRPEFSKAELERKRGLVYDSVEFVERFKSETLPSKPNVGEPFEPMAAKSKDVPSDDKWVGQYKVDGYRLLIHVKDGSAKGFTRSLKDETNSIPELQRVEWPEGEYIFDCEAVAYTPEGEPLGFKETSKRIGRKHDILTDEREIYFKMFDLIYANEDLTKKPFTERFERLQDVCPTDSKYVSILPLFDDIPTALNKAEEKDMEGIIAKDKNSKYKLKRSSSWRKAKVTDETIDLRIVGFEQEYNSGGEVTLGSVELETQDGVFVGNMGTGFSDDECKEIWNNQDEYYGTVVEVKFEGFDEKLRFPSFKTFRPDGEPDTLERIKNIIS